MLADTLRSRVHRTVAVLAVLVTVASSCASPPPSSPAATRSVNGWASPLNRDHPLVGKIWDVARARFASEAELSKAVVAADFLLLGEKHDNADHHRLQAALVRALEARGPRVAVAFEMIDETDQAKVDRQVAAAPEDMNALAAVLHWEKSGWPSWETYAPVFRATASLHFRIVAAGLPSETAHALVLHGASGIDASLFDRLGLAEPLAANLTESLRQELRATHCGHLPEKLFDGMALAQRARDATMAERLVASSAPASAAVLICGTGHARKDRGVPAYLAKKAAGRAIVSVGFAEVDVALADPPAYASVWNTDTLPFDYVQFTPRATDADPCEGFKRRSARVTSPLPPRTTEPASGTVRAEAPVSPSDS